MKLILLSILLAVAVHAATVVEITPPLPACICDEKAIKGWIERTVHDAPPVGGLITMLKHWPPHYTNNDRVGEIWIITAVNEVSMGDGREDHELDFCVYHVDTGKSTVEVSMGIPPESLSDYLK